MSEACFPPLAESAMSEAQKCVASAIVEDRNASPGGEPLPILKG
jgi:hypothetical protein